MIKAINFGRNVALNEINSGRIVNRNFRIDSKSLQRPGVFSTISGVMDISIRMALQFHIWRQNLFQNGYISLMERKKRLF